MKPDLSILPEPDRSVEPRRPLTRRETVELALRQGGLCGCGCAVKLDAMGEGFIDEHVIALALGGTNDLANRQLWRKPCAKAKTAKKDAPAIAATNRIVARETNTRRPRKPIPGRGFGINTRKFNGEVGPKRSARREKDGAPSHD